MICQHTSDWTLVTTQQALDELVVDVVGLRKSFGSFHALDGLDLQVRQGEVHGFLGPNGAGKSTTIRILLGLVRSSDGQAKLDRKSTRLNSSHVAISYAVFCLKKTKDT